jgi:transcriptional regulator with XRE-family HTH domain
LTLNSCQASGPLFSAVMATKSQHAERYRLLPPLLRALREEAGLTQRDLAGRLARPQSWVYNCETANRRVDVTEFIAWSEACGVDPRAAFDRHLGPGEPDDPPRPRRDPVTPR